LTAPGANPRSKRERASAILAAPPLKPLVLRLPRWRGILVLNYHRIGDRDQQPWDRALYNADAEAFDAQIEGLAANTDIVSLDDVGRLVRERRPGRSVLLTFDDGYRDNYEVAYPILRRHGAPAAFFVATGFLDHARVPWWDEIAWMVRHTPSGQRVVIPNDTTTLSLDPSEVEATIATLITRYKSLPAERQAGFIEQISAATGSGRCSSQMAEDLWMTWDMVRELRAAGMSIGGHTDSHPILARLAQETQAHEVSRCAARIADQLGEPMKWFAYPVGSRDTFTPTTTSLLREHDIEFGFSFYGGFAHFDRWNPFDVPRVHVSYNASPAVLQAASLLPMLLARRDPAPPQDRDGDGGARERASHEVRPPRLRVRTRNDYTVPFLVDLGQRNATFVKRGWTPLLRLIDWADAFAILPEPDFDIVHAVNSIPILTRRRYVLTYEDYLPRVPEDRYVGWLEARLQRELLSPRCVALIAISEYALRQFRWQNRGFPGRHVLEAKTEVLYPAVRLRRERPKERLGDTLRVLFVGRDFMRKGGPAVVKAHERLRARGVPVVTTVVSGLRWSADEYIGPPSAKIAEREHARLLAADVIHHSSLANADVLKLMEEADFFVFPTLHDTFGYVALEALAAGTPVIATATNALPEVIQDGYNGFLLPLELDEHLGRWAWTHRTQESGYLAAYEASIEALAKELADRLTACWNEPDSYASLSAGALASVRERFAVEHARDRLERLYERCR
jgi:glycosyltransferase involved in cell wall biosynthesis